jgi:prevent-host-death family protein
MSRGKTMTATEFKAKCLSVLEHLDRGGLIVTKRGRPLARVLPMDTVENERMIGSMKGKIKIKGDLLSTGVNWNAERPPLQKRAPVWISNLTLQMRLLPPRVSSRIFHF